MLIAREVFDAIGELNEDYFFTFEDLAFCLKARRAGFATVLAARARAYHQGGQSLPPGSPDRLYFAARNHLLAARESNPDAGPMASAARTTSIVLLNLAHAMTTNGSALPIRLSAVVQGTRDYFAGRFGPRRQETGTTGTTGTTGPRNE